MKKYTLYLLAILALPITLSSCFSENEEPEYSEKCYISALSLGTLKRTIYLKTSAGKDSVYTTTFSGAYFPMTIDQRTDTIQNLDSLPIRTNLSAVLVSVSFESGLIWRKAEPKDAADTIWTAYSSSDSIDLRQPLHFRTYSDSGKSFRTYTVKVNVHQQRGDSTTWNNLGQVAVLEGIGERKALVWNDRLTVLGAKADGSIYRLQKVNITDGEWLIQPTTGASGANPTTVQARGGALYVSTADGSVLKSTDGLTWTATAYPAMEGLTLVGAGDDCLYALCDRKLYRSEGDAWAEETLDAPGENLPTGLINSVLYTMKDGTRRLTLVGTQSDTDTSATLWAKSWTKGGEQQASWMYYTPNASDKYRLAVMENLCVLPYDGGMQAFGGKSRDGRYAAMDSIFHSSDHGITWKTYADDDMNVDTELQADVRSAQYLAATVDEQQFLWIIADDKVWRGRINRLGFLRQDK